VPWFLFKTEPGEYSFADLQRDGRCVWSGVTNPGALIALRAIRRRDQVLIYHTGDERAVVGVAHAASDAYADPARPGTAPGGGPRFAVVDLTPVEPLAVPVPLARIKADPRFAEFDLVRRGRLSVMHVPDPIADAILQLGQG
jgi:predicted RNA-binding protein with PUA-like domain